MNKITKILIIDDERAVLNFLKVLFAQVEKYEVDLLQDSRKAYSKLESRNYDILLLDMDMPYVSGLDILKFIKKKDIDIETIVLTGVDDVELAVSAMKAGAYDYLRKPIDNDLLLLTIERALERRRLKEEVAILKEDRWECIKNRKPFEGIITNHPKMIKIFKFIEKIAPTKTSVLIWGESGTGKELIAKAIHKASDRKDKQFITVNAGAFARELFASEFFGYIRGAFSGANSDKKGFLEEADGGTLFMDEIGELPIEVQVKLLRVLQSGEFFRVGSTKLMKTDIRLIAATNKDLWTEIKKGTFRKDLFYRLEVNTITLPPLRERKEDIPLLVRHFLKECSFQYNKRIEDVSDAVLELLERYDFPGNVRELQNIIHSAALVEQSNILRVSSLPERFLKEVKGEVKKKITVPEERLEALSLEEVEKNHIKKVLKLVGGNKSKAAKILGISRVTLMSKIKKYKL